MQRCGPCLRDTLGLVDAVRVETGPDEYVLDGVQSVRVLCRVEHCAAQTRYAGDRLPSLVGNAGYFVAADLFLCNLFVVLVFDR